MEITSLNTILYCHRWYDTAVFYKHILKFPENMATEWFIEFRLTDTAFLSVADATRCSISSSEGKGLTLSLNVPDLAAWYSYCDRQDLGPTQIKFHSWGQFVFYIFDPEGNRIEFWSENEPPPYCG